HIDDVQITLGSSAGGSVTLGAEDVTFTEQGLTVTGAALGPSPVNALLSCQGDVTFALAGGSQKQGGVNGLITVEAMGGALTIDAGDGTFTLTGLKPTDDLGTVAPSTTSHPAQFKALVTQESSLFFKGRKIDTKSVGNRAIIPVIQIEGAADIAEGVTLGGDGILSLDSGGHLSIQGTVDLDEYIVFADG